MRQLGRMIAVALFVVCVLAVDASWSQEYTIGYPDILKIVVWGHDDLSKDYPVDADGLVPFPLVGRIRAAGLTTKDFSTRLAAALEKDYLVNPQVLVMVKEYLSKKVHVLGEADKPGLFYLTGPTSLLEILSKAGVAKSAGRQIVLIRQVRTTTANGPTAGSSIVRLDLAKIQSGDAKENVILQHDDTVLIPKGQAVFVLGEVMRAGSFSLDKEISVLEAITLAGGFSEKASASGVKILRRNVTGGQETLSVDLSGSAKSKDRDIALREGDTVVVPKGNMFFVFGEVRNPGGYFLDKAATVLEAITVAGGFTPFAQPSTTRIVRTTSQGEQIIPVNMNDVIRRGKRDKAIELRENDVVIVP